MTSDPLARFLNQRSARFQRRGRLRPMQSGEVMDAAIGAYQSLGATILKYTAIPTLLCLASVVFITAYVVPALQVTSAPGDVKVQVGEAAFAMFLGMFAGAPLFLMGLCYSSALITGLVSDFMVGSPPEPAEWSKRALSLTPRLLGLTLLELLTACLGFIVAIGFFMVSALLDSSGNQAADLGASATGVTALVVGFVIFPVVLSRHALAVPLVVIEGLRALPAAKRSKGLLKSKRLDTSGISTVYSLLFLMLFLALFIFGGIYSTLQVFETETVLQSAFSGHTAHDLLVQAVRFLPWFLVIWTVVPVWCTTVTILYYERRTRVEGYDIESLAQDALQHGKQSRFEL